jgi:hypothetical protein
MELEDFTLAVPVACNRIIFYQVQSQFSIAKLPASYDLIW